MLSQPVPRVPGGARRVRHGQRCSPRVPGTHKTLLALRPRVCEKIQAHTLPVPLLPQLRPNFTIFIVKCVVGGGFAVVVIIFPGTRKGLIPLAALSDVLMIYRHSLGKAGILLPGSLKKLCTGSLCSAGLGDGGERAIGARGSGGTPSTPGVALLPPLSQSRSWGNVQLPLQAQPVCGVTRRAQSPSQGLQLLSWTSFLCVYILTRTDLSVLGFLRCGGFVWFYFFLRRCGCSVPADAGDCSISQLHLSRAGHGVGEPPGTVRGWLVSEGSSPRGSRQIKVPLKAQAVCHSEGTARVLQTLGTRHRH